MMDQPDKKRPQMATAAIPIDHAITRELKSRLSAIPEVMSLHFTYDKGVFSTWVGVNNYEKSVRYSIYEIEDEIEDCFQDVRFDFHIAAIPKGRDVDDFISHAHLVYKRTA